MKIFSKAYCLSVALLAGLSSQPVLGQTAANPPPGYFDIPAGFDYPADKRLLEQYRLQPNVAAQRIHAWNLLAGLTRPTTDGKFSIFETWFSEDETFASRAQNLRGRGPSMPLPKFSVPRQFEASRGANEAAVALTGPGSSVLSFVLYNFAGGTDAQNPGTASLVRDKSGNLYGVTPFGGANVVRRTANRYDPV